NAKPNPRSARYETFRRLDYATHGERFALSNLDRADGLGRIASVLQTGDGRLKQRADAVRSDARKLWEQRESAKALIVEDIRSAGDVYNLPTSDWQRLATSIEGYLKLVEVDLVPEQNRIWTEVSKLESMILDQQRKEVDRRKLVSSIIKRIAL